MHKCSFCGKTEDDVYHMVAKDENTAICDECILQCMKDIFYTPDPVQDHLDKEVDKFLEKVFPKTEGDEDEISNVGC